VFVLFKRSVKFAILILAAPALMSLAGCQGFNAGSWRELAHAANDSKADSKKDSASRTADGSDGSNLSAGDRAILACNADKDPKSRGRSVWIRTVDAEAKFRWHYPKLEDILARPADRRPDFHALLSDKDPIVAANAAMALARNGDGAGQVRLAEIVRSPESPLPTRCAAVEALANLQDPKAADSLKELLDQYGRFEKGVKSAYIPDLHAELIRGLGRRVELADNARFVEALRSPSAPVRLEALKALCAKGDSPIRHGRIGTDPRTAKGDSPIFADAKIGTVPIEAVDLRTDGDYRVRSAALELIALHRHPQAAEYLSSALMDTDVRVRHAAIAGLGVLNTPETLSTLQKLLKDPNESIRAQAVSALGTAKAEKPVLEAAGDKSWRVRRKVAEALASFSDRDAANAAEQMLDDNSAEVQLALVQALQAWPLERSGPILLAAMTKSAFVTRKAAAEQLAAKWPPAREFPIEGPLERRTEVQQKLSRAFHSEFSTASLNRLSQADQSQQAAKKAAPAQVAEVERFIKEKNFTAMADYGPALVDALEQLHLDAKQPLPDEIYREVLPKYGRVFVILDNMTAADVSQRRRAAEQLAELSGKQPLGRLAIARLAQISSAEQDTLIWQGIMRAIADDGSRQAIDMAYTAVGHSSADVRRRACEHLAAHPDPAHVQVLVPVLEDKDHAVVCAAARALAATGNRAPHGDCPDFRVNENGTVPFRPTPETQALHKLLLSTNEDIQLEAALALTRLGDPSGKPALERLSYSRDPLVRAKTAKAMGDFPDSAFTEVLIRFLNDNLTVAKAALNSLPKVVGEDIAQAPGQAPATTTEQILRWKHWHERKSLY
jgi:HEAT repeat protein